jgi:hypothetical protein
MSTTRRTYHGFHANPEVDDDAPPPPPPNAGAPEGVGSKAWGVGKALLLAGATAVAAVIAVDVYRKFTKKKSPEDELLPNPAAPAAMLPGTVNVMPGAPSIMPMPMPMPWPSFGMQPHMEQAQRNIAGGGMTPEEQIKLEQIKAARAKDEALKAQMEAFMNEED